MTEERHVMIDIETLSTRHDAHVISLAFADFDPYAADSLNPNAVVSVVPKYQSTAEHGHIDPDTVAWHLQRGHTVPEQTCYSGAIPRILHSLEQGPMCVQDSIIGGWPQIAVRSGYQLATHIWSKSPDFDMVILKSLHRRIDPQAQWPFSYRIHRDVRTICGLAGIDVSTSVTHKHDMVEDVIVQAHAVRDAMRILGINGPVAPTISAFREDHATAVPLIGRLGG